MKLLKDLKEKQVEYLTEEEIRERKIQERIERETFPDDIDNEPMSRGELIATAMIVLVIVLLLAIGGLGIKKGMSMMAEGQGEVDENELPSWLTEQQEESEEPSEEKSFFTVNVCYTPSVMTAKEFTMQASSVMYDGGVKRHAVEKLIDGNPKTYWAEGVSGDGIGEYVRYTSEKANYVNAIYIQPGWLSTERAFNKNSCPTKLEIKVGDICEEVDISAFQWAKSKPYMLIRFAETLEVKDLTITIKDARTGYYANTCISEMYLVETNWS